MNQLSHLGLYSHQIRNKKKEVWRETFKVLVFFCCVWVMSILQPFFVIDQIKSFHNFWRLGTFIGVILLISVVSLLVLIRFFVSQKVVKTFPWGTKNKKNSIFIYNVYICIIVLNCLLKLPPTCMAYKEHLLVFSLTEPFVCVCVQCSLAVIIKSHGAFKLLWHCQQDLVILEVAAKHLVAGWLIMLLY